ncbi:MAG: choice-of-anchor D domain-containing protein [Gemmatimonadetes bacterium]|nr:choice-of-anchor D domain-containing protein [Gemmatimonadota bacterium]MBT7863878.1 choice-of-anchor D domain-containing protein [Gemmatimonadota bacterium]
MRVLTHIRRLLMLVLALGYSQVHGQSLQVEPDPVDFGVTRPGDTVRRSVRLTNAGNDRVEVHVEIGAPFAAAVDTLFVEAKASSDLELSFSSPLVRDFNGALDLSLPKLFGSDKLHVVLRARVSQPTLDVRPAAGPTFEDVNVGEVSTATIEISNPSPVGIQIDEVSIEPILGPFSVTGGYVGELLAGETRSIELSFEPQTGGSQRARLHVRSSHLSEGSLVVPLRGNGLAPSLAVSPLPQVGFRFGAADVGTSTQRFLTLLNSGHADLQISSITTSGGGLTVSDSILTIAPDERRDLTVTYTPRYEGPLQGQIRLTSNDPAYTEITLLATGSAHVGPPRIEILNRSPIHFGAAPLGRPIRQQVLLWNRGGSPFTVKMELEGGVHPEFELENTAALLQPGESAKVEILFRPKEIGERRVTLTVMTEEGSQRFELVGTGKFLQLSPTTFDFDRVPVGESASAVVDLANIGNSDFTISRLHSTSDDFTLYTQVSVDNKYLLPANSLRTLPLNITYAPGARGLSSGTLRIEGFWEEGTETMEMLLNGTGVAAEIELHPPGPMDVGYVILGQTETRPLVATNTGDTALRVAANSLSDEVRLEPEAFALEPGESTTLKVHFTAKALGERFAQILLVSNDVHDKAQPIKVRGIGALESIDLTRITQVLTSRKADPEPSPVNWNNTPLVLLDGTKIDVAFTIPDSLRQALIGRRINVEWVQLDDNYDPKGSARQTTIDIYEDAEGHILAEDLNLRLSEDGNRRVRMRVTTRSYPDAPPQTVTQIFEAGGWKFEFEAKPLVSFLTIRPGRNYRDKDGNPVKGDTERLIGLPGIAFAGWHNSENPSVSGIHLTAIGNVLEALSTNNSIAISLGVAVSLYKDRLLFGFGYDIYDSRSKAKQRGTADYIFTFKYSALF